MSEYDPIFSPPQAPDDRELDAVRGAFEAASRPYLRSPWVWLAWGLLLPAAALLTPMVARRFGYPGVLFLWSLAILAGGGVEISGIRRRDQGRSATALAAWVLRTQGNLSLVALLLSALLLWHGRAEALPGTWLLLLGHSFFALGGLAFRPFRAYGILLQGGGLVALWPGIGSLGVFAVTTAAANLWLAYRVWRRAKGVGA